jgi:CS domain
LEFDEFMRIGGCNVGPTHLFVGSKKSPGEEEEKVKDLRSDFYQTPSLVHASLYLKKVKPPPISTITFAKDSIVLDLPTSDGKRYSDTLQLWGAIEAEGSEAKIMGTKVELTLKKADGASWPVLRKEDTVTGIYQVGKAGRMG